MKQLSALKIGQKYTFVKLSEFGFPHAAKIELVEFKIEPYAQYPETAVLKFKLKGKRNLRGLRVFERDNFLVYEGWVEVNTEMYVETLPATPGTFACQRSLSSFDNEYLLRAKRSVTQIPLIENIRVQNS